MQPAPEATNTTIATWQSRGGKYRACLVRSDFPGCTAAQSITGKALAPTSNYYLDDYVRTTGTEYRPAGRLYLCEGAKGEEHARTLMQYSLQYHSSAMHLVPNV